ncbi:MAG: 2-oxo acid dehydrogenase subunit E2 [Lachnospiraceae bacterium]|nr:2-oxo acid dehydrogenase subunit E2 [Lachnospiraceae bacterium]
MTEIKMPSAGQTTDEAKIVSVNVKVGDKVKRGDVIVEAETDKAVLPVESFASGEVIAVLVEPGSTVTAGTVLVAIGKAGEVYGDAGKSDGQKTAEVEAEPQKSETPAVEKTEEIAPTPEYIPIIKGGNAVTPAASDAPAAPAAVHYSMPAMPGAKALAKERGIDISLVNAANGQFVKRSDVAAYSAGTMDDGPEYEVMEMNNIRQIIARRMLESVSTIPAWQGSVIIKTDAATSLRRIYKEQKDIKLSYNDIAAKAIAVASRRFPLVNARFENGEVRIFRHTNVGLAVGLPGALVVPVVKNIDVKSLEQISADYRAMVKKAREGRLLPDDMGCGSVTISNLGMYDTDSFTAIINPPESCILAVGAINTVPEWNGSEFVPVNVMKVTGSFDHRIIDGAYGAQFLQEFKALMEDPVRLFM